MRMMLSMELFRVEREELLKQIEGFFEKDYGVEIKYSKRVKTFTREENTLEDVDKFLGDCECIQRLKDYRNYIKELEKNREEINSLTLDFIEEDLSDYHKVIDFFCDTHKILKKYQGTGALKLPSGQISSKLKESGYKNLDKVIHENREEYLKYNKDLKQMTLESDNEDLIAEFLIADTLDCLNMFRFLDPKMGECFELYNGRFKAEKEEEQFIAKVKKKAA